MLLFDSRLTRRTNTAVASDILLREDGILLVYVAIVIGYDIYILVLSQDDDDTRYIKIFSSFVCDILLSLLFTLTSNLLQYDDDYSP